MPLSYFYFYFYDFIYLHLLLFIKEVDDEKNNHASIVTIHLVFASGGKWVGDRSAELLFVYEVLDFLYVYLYARDRLYIPQKRSYRIKIRKTSKKNIWTASWKWLEKFQMYPHLVAKPSGQLPSSQFSPLKL